MKQARLAIFSIWRSLDATAGPTNSFYTPLDHEASGWSCKVEDHWMKGVKYCLRISKLCECTCSNELGWWRGTIINTVTNQETIIGDIKAPPEWGGLRKNPSCFTEYDSQTVNEEIGDEDDGQPNPRVCELIPLAEVLIDPPQADTGTVQVLALTTKNYGGSFYFNFINFFIQCKCLLQ